MRLLKMDFKIFFSPSPIKLNHVNKKEHSKSNMGNKAKYGIKFGYSINTHPVPLQLSS